MPDSLERCLEAALRDSSCIGQILIRRTGGGRFVLCHRDDEGRNDLQVFQDSEDVVELARYDDAGNYRPLKTAPDLRHGWRLEIGDFSKLRRALDYFYPGRLAVLAAWKGDRLTTIPLRQTLNRQSGMYRVAAKISDQQINDLVGSFCRSGGGCLRTILWKRDAGGALPSTKLPPEKFDIASDQARRPGSSSPATRRAIPLLCQEACNLLVNECRKVVKSARPV
jgi:sirohydrochlorin cobaltochelatase